MTKVRNEIPFEVRCRSSYPFFETIAAFDHIKIAYRYAQDCKKTNPTFEYQLRHAESGKTYSVSAYKDWGFAS